jgi:hypothetical protein
MGKEDAAMLKKVQEAMDKIREKHRQYRTYVRNFAALSAYKRFTGRADALEFPIEALSAARKRLLGVSFSWNNPVQLALRLAVSMGVKLQ